MTMPIRFRFQFRLLTTNQTCQTMQGPIEKKINNRSKIIKMKYIKITTILFLTILLTSCYKEDKIESELGKPHHQIEFKDNPVDKYIYEMYTNTGVAIRS